MICQRLPLFRALKWFSATHGLLRKILSDNAKTFKAATKLLKTISECHEVKDYLSNVGVEWVFNPEPKPPKHPQQDSALRPRDRMKTWTSDIMEDEYGWPLSLHRQSTGGGCRELWTLNCELYYMVMSPSFLLCNHLIWPCDQTCKLSLNEWLKFDLF